MSFTKHVVFAALFVSSGLAQAAPAEFDILIKDHKFTPSNLTVPVGTRIKLKVTNADPTAEEFERLQTQAKELGATTSFSASQVAQLQLELRNAQGGSNNQGTPESPV